MYRYALADGEADFDTVRSVRARVVEQILARVPGIPPASHDYMRTDYFLAAEQDPGFHHVLLRRGDAEVGVVTVCCPVGEGRMPSEKYCQGVRELKSGRDAEVFQLYVIDPERNPAAAYHLALLAYRVLRQEQRRTVFINYFDPALSSFYATLGFRFVARQVDNGLDTVYMHHDVDTFEANPTVARLLKRMEREYGAGYSVRRRDG
jgi:hypothetical protein